MIRSSQDRLDRVDTNKMRFFMAIKRRRALLATLGVMLTIFLMGFLFYINGANKLREFSAVMRSVPQMSDLYSGDFFQRDFSPTIVGVEWHETEKVPAVSGDAPSEIMYAFELGAANGRIVLWFHDQEQIITINESDVSISRAPEWPG